MDNNEDAGRLGMKDERLSRKQSWLNDVHSNIILTQRGREEIKGGFNRALRFKSLRAFEDSLLAWTFVNANKVKGLINEALRRAN